MNYYTKKQYKKQSEATEQETVIQWCGWHEGKHPELKLIFHIPNGGSRNILEAANLKRQGVKAGVPDLCLPVPKNGYHGLYIEMKYGKNKTTKKQEEWLKALWEQGYYVAVCYGAEEAEQLIASYLQIAGYPALEQAEKKGEGKKRIVEKIQAAMRATNNAMRGYIPHSGIVSAGAKIAARQQSKEKKQGNGKKKKRIRLTEVSRGSEKPVLCQNVIVNQAAKKLYDYEETGLAPYEVQTLIEREKVLTEQVKKMQDW